MMNRFAWTAARTVAEACAGASTTVADAMTALPDASRGPAGSVLKAGGIDLLDLLKAELLAPATVVSLAQVPGLATIAEGPGGDLRIGAMVTLATLAADPQVKRRYPMLGAAAQASASPQIRNVATLGGNLLQRPRCWYFREAEYHCLRKGGGRCFAIAGESQYHAIFDNGHCAIVHPSTAATALVALGAQVELSDAAGATRRVLLEEFFVSPDQDVQRENGLRPHEVLTAVLLPAPAAGARMAHLKQGEKASFDWPLADVAVVLELVQGRCRRAAIVLGAAAPVPHRARAAEAALTGQHIDAQTAGLAARAALEGATPLAKNGYKLPLFETLVRRAILAAAGPQAMERS